ncbi:hypothetical protein LIPSTDRAFT_181320 [Lipomyces starkeyi NRRL Y-11557]|uniref:Uncharacterized protein n=1 Tax=Lipomyces starkeyi NRRL Y-11557 TaxID=675824 RepID=A0A1E3PWU0_LIPST|nr:hypothetical protein LIPSTDRAFT_181320 [Lipomyces starkeyi NRRL Y-11557]
MTGVVDPPSCDDEACNCFSEIPRVEAICGDTSTVDSGAENSRTPQCVNALVAGLNRRKVSGDGNDSRPASESSCSRIDCGRTILSECASVPRIWGTSTVNVGEEVIDLDTAQKVVRECPSDRTVGANSAFKQIKTKKQQTIERNLFLIDWNALELHRSRAMSITDYVVAQLSSATTGFKCDATAAHTVRHLLPLP